jgi:hypothetical protein
MAVEVMLSEESSIPQEEMVDRKVETDSDSDPVPAPTEKKIEAEEVTVPVVEKAASFREESNFLSDLKENERKALFDLRTRIEEAISTKTLFVEKEKEKEAEGEKEVKCIDERDRVEEEVRKKKKNKYVMYPVFYDLGRQIVFFSFCFLLDHSL